MRTLFIAFLSAGVVAALPLRGGWKLKAFDLEAHVTIPTQRETRSGNEIPST